MLHIFPMYMQHRNKNVIKVEIYMLRYYMLEASILNKKLGRQKVGI